MLPKYYPPDYWIFSASADHAQSYFLGELIEGMQEAFAGPEPVRAGFIKIACQARIEENNPALLEAAAAAARQSGCAIEVHTEKGSQAERYAAYLIERGISPERLVLCHVDKRPDFSLHSELAQAGVLLEYDTFYRPKYNPEQNLWPLLGKMLTAGYVHQIAVATDMAETSLWTQYGGSPGLNGLFNVIRPRLEALGALPSDLAQLLGGNIGLALAYRPASD